MRWSGGGRLPSLVRTGAEGTTGVICPYCGANEDRVIDSRASEGGRVVRRRRACEECGRRFTTYERVEDTSRLMVIKRDGSREPFDRAKMLRGVQSACGKRPVSEDAKVALVDTVEEDSHRMFEREAPSWKLGEMVMLRLRDLDEVAFIRFASEHYNFRSVEDIKAQVEEMADAVRDVKAQQRLFEG